MARRFLIASGLALVLLLGLSAPVLAQGTVTGTVQGTIKDDQGSPLPGVTVTAASSALVKGKLTTVTDTRGGYRFPALPPGTYVIAGDLSGFKKVEQPNVRVTLGQSLAVDLTMRLAGVKAEAVVTGEAPIVSTVSNNVATSFGQEYIDKQAVPRNYYQVISTAPGVNADSTSSSGSAILAYGGTTESQNAYTLDGVNIADSGSGQHWILPSIQWMEEIQVTGLGANAEYGGYTGGVINGVTKSGGNEFKGGLEAYLQPEAWTSNNDPNGAAQQTFKFEDYSASLGGPIAKDKLWFFGSVEYWHQVTTPLGAEDTSDRKIPRFLGKLTYQINEKNRLFGMAEYDAVTNERRGIGLSSGKNYLASGSQKQDGPGASFSANWESLINSSNFINVKITGYDGNDDYLAYSGTGVPGHDDYLYGLSGTVWGNAPFTDLSHRHLVTGDASWSLFSDGLFGKSDSHSFKFGALYEEASATDSWRRNGGFTYYDDSSLCPGDSESEQIANYYKNPACGYTERSKGYGEYEVHGQHKGFTFYAQDSMRLSRVSVNFGLRYTSYRAGWQEGWGDSTVYKADFLDPRIGFVWDIAGNSRWALKAHWGRYHSSMYTYLYDREQSGHATIQDADSEWDSDTMTWGPFEPAGAPIAAPIGDVSHPYVDETLFSLEHQLTQDMALGFDFIDRRFNSLMGLVNTNNDYVAKTVPNPITGQTMTIWSLNSAQKYVLTTSNDGARTYDSLVLRYDKRYSHGWQLRSSLVWTDLKGNVLKNNGYAPELQDKNGLINADGRMDYSYNEWEYKLSGAVDLPLGIVFGGQYTFLSGQYWTPQARYDGLNYNSSTGRYVYIEERGTEKLPSRSILDLRLAWGTKIANAFRLDLSLECFNVLNTNRALTVDNYYGRYRTSGAWNKNATYGQATSIETPRMLRAGVRVSF